MGKGRQQQGMGAQGMAGSKARCGAGWGGGEGRMPAASPPVCPPSPVITNTNHLSVHLSAHHHLHLPTHSLTHSITPTQARQEQWKRAVCCSCWGGTRIGRRRNSWVGGLGINVPPIYVGIYKTDETDRHTHCPLFSLPCFLHQWGMVGREELLAGKVVMHCPLGWGLGMGNWGK